LTKLPFSYARSHCISETIKQVTRTSKHDREIRYCFRQTAAYCRSIYKFSNLKKNCLWYGQQHLEM